MLSTISDSNSIESPKRNLSKLSIDAYLSNIKWSTYGDNNNDIYLKNCPLNACEEEKKLH